jgi:hypothetical protein
MWNRRKSPMTMTPARRASGKAPFNTRVLWAVSGAPLYWRGELALRRAQRELRDYRDATWGYV